MAPVADGASTDKVWEVVGGAEKGGIVVRVGRELASAEEEIRLATGSLVQELARAGVRLRYRLLKGTGPASGWVSTRTKDNPLLEKKSATNGAATNGVVAGGGTNGQNPEAPKPAMNGMNGHAAVPSPAAEIAKAPQLDARKAAEPRKDNVNGTSAAASAAVKAAAARASVRATFESSHAVPAVSSASNAGPMRGSFLEAAEGLDGPEGLWQTEEGRSFFELRAEVPGQLWKLHYYQRLADGMPLQGTCTRLEVPVPGSNWTWEGELTDNVRMRLRLEGSTVVSSFKMPDSVGWERERRSTRPQAYAFYNANANTKGFRYVQICGHASQGFPIVGMTAGWMPATLQGDGSNWNYGRTCTVRFNGTFCDPFECVTHPPVVRQPPPHAYPRYSGPPFGARVPVKGKGGPAPWTKALGAPDPRHFVRPGGPPRPPRFQFPAMRPGEPSTSVVAGQAHFRGKLRVTPKSNQISVPQVELNVAAELIRPGDGVCPPRPLLSILCVRWFDYWSDPSQSSDYSTLNDGMFMDLFEGPCSMGKRLPGEYEVFTIFMRSSRDFARLKPEHLRALLRGRNVAVWYFVWPSSDVFGFVSEREFFTFCRAMERLPIRNCWPHPTHLYRILCGKQWIPQMSLNKSFRVPPTTRIHYADFRRDGKKAALKALGALMRLRESVWGKPPADLDEFRGVVKLGFSWGGDGVLPFKGVSNMVRNLKDLFEHHRNENVVCLVQEMVPGVVGEHRVLCMWDKARGNFWKEPLWMLCNKPAGGAFRVDEFRMASSSVVPSFDVASKFFRGDREAQKDAEEEAQRVVDRWLKWFKTESPEPPQTTRIDFMVSHPSPGQAEIWTCEVGECGASLCTVEVHGRNTASLNSVVIRDDKGRFPMRFPEVLPRNTGWKS